MDPACFPWAKIVVDGMDGARADGKIPPALANGAIQAGDIYAQMAEVIISFESSGVAIQDLACAVHCYRKATELGVGTLVELGDA